jgi:GntR family transcriptional regulator/MocR family aminotransferase
MTVPKPGPLASLDPRAATPFYRQIYDRVRDAITSGVLKPGDRIPSARALTKELGLARGTIEAAYSLLVAEGYIQARGQAGTIVTPDLKPPLSMTTPPPRLDAGIAATSFRPDSILPFQMGLPPSTCFRADLGRLGAMRAGHAAVRHGSSCRLWPAGTARVCPISRFRAASIVPGPDFRDLELSSPPD